MKYCKAFRVAMWYSELGQRITDRLRCRVERTSAVTSKVFVFNADDAEKLVQFCKTNGVDYQELEKS